MNVVSGYENVIGFGWRERRQEKIIKVFFMSKDKFQWQMMEINQELATMKIGLLPL